jgi:hypothetical protein
MRFHTLILAALLTTGCGQSFLRPVEAYSAMPVSASEFVERSGTYHVVMFPIPPDLRASESGTAWKLLVRHQDDETEHIATFMVVMNQDGDHAPVHIGHGDGEVLTALVFAGSLDGATSIIQSHDGVYCWNLEGELLGRCRDPMWDNASSIQDFALTAMPGSDLDKTVTAWYTDLETRAPHATETNFALGPDELEHLETKDQVTGVKSIAMLGVLGSIALVLGGPIAAAATAGAVGYQDATSRQETPAGNEFASNNVDRLMIRLATKRATKAEETALHSSRDAAAHK